CNAESCPTLTVNVASVADFCLGGAASPVQLTATVTGSNGTGTGTWSGPGVTGSTFDPAQAGLGQHTVVYTFEEATCTYTGSTTISVYQQPTADFTLDNLICVADFATVNFTGVAGANAVFTWNFDGGTASPGIGPGPHQVEWDTPGPKTVTLSVTQDGCSSSSFTQQIQVDEELATPVIICSATTASVDFSWNDVANATGYTVAVLNGPAGTQTLPTSYSFTNLNPGQQVVIQVTANGNTVCLPPVATATCNALPCPNFTVSIDPVAPMCLTGNNAVVDLVGDVDGVGQSGFGTWSGTGIVDTVQGIFDPAVAGVGTHHITFTYQQGNCFYEDETDLEITAPPVADAGQDAALTCWETEQTAILGGPGTTLGADIVYQWSAAGGSFPGAATALHPEVTVPGTYTLMAANMALGCSDSDEVTVTSTQSTPVPELDIQPLNCHGEKDGHLTVTNVSGGVEPYLFSLNDAPFVVGNTFPFLEAGEYELTVIDAQGCENSVSFRIDDPGDLSIELTANLGSENLIEYGDSVQLNTTVSLPESDLDSIAWTNSGVLSCADCLDPVATPVAATTFRVTVFVNGCEASDELTIFVENNNSVYAPTAFSPNGDAVNDLFRLYSGPTVVRIKTFYVFDRWGEMVYRYQDFDTSDPSIGWDGSFDGKPMNPAMFVWFAEVEFIDGSMKVLEGEVSLIR
ncbi:MAG: T9SS type B sorting domain-containing protein, partial [Bacteroidetes bacterium]|nr:T9SS type B sorting domain-containing protein [Bacteroidota bacterium]